MIVDWNRKKLDHGQVFHFKNSLRPFIEICTASDNTLFLDVDKMVAYDFSLCFKSMSRNSLFFCTYSKISYILCLVLHILNEFNISSRDKTNI